MHFIFNAFGYVGASLVAFMLLPQILHTRRQKDASGIAWPFAIAQMAISACFSVYGSGLALDSGWVTGGVVLFPNLSAFTLSVYFAMLKLKLEDENTENESEI